MRNNRPSNTIINAVLLVLALFSIYLFGNFIVSLFNTSSEIDEEKLSISPASILQGMAKIRNPVRVNRQSTVIAVWFRLLHFERSDRAPVHLTKPRYEGLQL